MEGFKTLKSCGEILNDRCFRLISHHTSSMKHHFTETHEHNFEIHNIVLSSESVSFRYLGGKLTEVKLVFHRLYEVKLVLHSLYEVKLVLHSLYTIDRFIIPLLNSC